MEKSPLRGTLAGKTPDTKPAEQPKLRGTLAASKPEKTSDTATEGLPVPKDRFPDIESLASLTGRTIIQRDSGLKCEFKELRNGVRATDGKIVKLVGENGFRYSLPAYSFLDAITTEGGAWRLLED